MDCGKRAGRVDSDGTGWLTQTGRAGCDWVGFGWEAWWWVRALARMRVQAA